MLTLRIANNEEKKLRTAVRRVANFEVALDILMETDNQQDVQQPEKENHCSHTGQTSTVHHSIGSGTESDESLTSDIEFDSLFDFENESAQEAVQNQKQTKTEVQRNFLGPVQTKKNPENTIGKFAGQFGNTRNRSLTQ